MHHIRPFRGNPTAVRSAVNARSPHPWHRARYKPALCSLVLVVENSVLDALHEQSGPGHDRDHGAEATFAVERAAAVNSFQVIEPDRTNASDSKRRADTQATRGPLSLPLPAPA